MPNIEMPRLANNMTPKEISAEVMRMLSADRANAFAASLLDGAGRSDRG